MFRQNQALWVANRSAQKSNPFYINVWDFVERGLLNKALVFAAFLLLLAPASGFGGWGGTLDTAVVVEILKQKPVLHEFVKNHLTLRDAAWGRRISSSESMRFGGGRIGPYEIWARSKSSKESHYDLELVVNTKLILKDAEGRAVKLLKDATTITEEVVNIEIHTLEPVQNER